jgi:hypothetical protein
VLTDVRDRDDVLSRIGHPLPVPVRQQITASWSIERTAGLGPRTTDSIMMFSGPGRTVHVEAFDTPAATTADAAIAEMSQGLPERCEGELSEHDDEQVRRAFWRTATVDGRPQHELYGYAATPQGILCITRVYDDASDLTWAQAVWRSARHDASGRSPGSSTPYWPTG